MDTQSIVERTPVPTMESQALNQETTSLVTSVPLVISEAKRKRPAPIWNHYTFFEKVENLIKVNYARCSHCGKEYKAESSMGTTTVKRHIEKCPVLKDKDISSTTSSFFDQKHFLHLFAKAIICHAYPLSMVEHEHTRDMLTYLNPNVKHVTRNTILKYCIKEHDLCRANLYEALQNVPGKISFTCDLWTACTSRGYLTLTAHYVDDSWTLRSKILNFRYCEPPHTGVAVEKFVFNLIKEWNLQGKAFAMTVDNARSMDVMVQALQRDLLVSSSLPCDGKFFHVRCCAHILNLIVQKGLKVVDKSVSKLRELVKYIDGSDTRLCQFEQAITEANCVFKGKLCLDVITRWNATFLMLQKALEAKYALILHAERYLPVGYQLDSEEWTVIETVFNFLQPFFDITVLFSGSEYPTANLYFESVVAIEYKLKEAHKNPILATMAGDMLEKFEDYWDSYSLILSIAVVLDLRYKFYRVNKAYNILIVPSAREEKVKLVKDALTNLYNHYSALYSSDSNSQRHVQTSRGRTKSDISRMLDESDDEEISCPSRRSGELDAYLTSERLRVENGEDFDILKFWGGQVKKFPILAMIARDVLAIPITSVASESSFSMGGRILNKYRSAMLPKHVEVFVTAQNWSRGYGADDITEDVLIVGKEIEAESISST